MTTTDLIAKLRRDVISMIEDVKEYGLLPDSILNWKEHAEKWSVLDCLEHLNRYSLYYNNEIRKAIERSPLDGTSQEARSTWMGRKFISMMDPDNTTKHKTFKRMNPVHGSLKREVINTFLANQKELLLLLEDASKVNLNKAYIRVEFLKILQMNLGDGFQFVIVHEQRHLR